jgi:hypothetical protein
MKKPPIIERHRLNVEHCRKVIGRQAATHFSYFERTWKRWMSIPSVMNCGMVLGRASHLRQSYSVAQWRAVLFERA